MLIDNSIPERLPLLTLRGVHKSFRSVDGAKRNVLENVDFTLYDNEIVALLGKSGSGKSTLLRITAGLIAADNGDVRYRNQPIYAPVAGIAMVFQSFALFPWLTVQQNVELGLEAQGMPAKAREKLADSILELIGLSGFGGALPRELSGGMRQRVGIARALVTNPDVLLMDEAFSALDVLTGETLRNDMLALWDNQRISTKGMLLVSHNIEEAVMMADRILILSSSPGRMQHEIRIALARPRNVDSSEVRALIDEIYGLMTMRPTHEAATGVSAAPHIGQRLPETDIDRMEAILDLLAAAPFLGRADLPKLAEKTELSDEELFPSYEALALLAFVQVEKGDIALTPLGRHYVDAEQTLKQQLFGQQLLRHVPLAAHIRHSLEQESSGALPEKGFLELLETFLKSDEASSTLKVAVEWGRYGEAYEYDYHTGRLHLPEGVATREAQPQD